MSHLQPNFIAKAKAGLKRSQAPRAMSRSMIVNVATSATSANKPRKKDPQAGWFWSTLPADYRIFSLKK